MAQDDAFSNLAWLGPDENPFHLRVLDCRSFSTTMISTTKDGAIAARFTHLRSANGEEHRGQHPDDAMAVHCDLSYPFNGEFHDGPLFVAQQMEDKWDIYLYDGHFYFTRSWTGELILRAAVEFRDRQTLVTSVEANRTKVMDDPALAVQMVDFLLKSHVYRKEAPHPLPPGLPEDKKILALYSFSEFGRWALYGSFEDTTKVKVVTEP